MFIRVPLAVEVVFSEDGGFCPKKITVDGRSFSVTRVCGIRNRVPCKVGSVAPVEYDVVIEGRRKKIYFEKYTNKWFAVREIDDSE